MVSKEETFPMPSPIFMMQTNSSSVEFSLDLVTWTKWAQCDNQQSRTRAAWVKSPPPTQRHSEGERHCTPAPLANQAAGEFYSRKRQECDFRGRIKNAL